MLGFVADQAWVARLGGERLIGSTEVLESLFGGFKGLQGQQSESGLTGLMLVLGALVSPWTPEEIEAALEAIPWKAVEAWVEERARRDGAVAASHPADDLLGPVTKVG